MANDILEILSASTAITSTLASLANNSARQTDQVVDASPSVPQARVFYRIRTGTSPTDGGVIEFYLSRADDNGTEHADGNTGASDAAFSGNVDELELVHVQIVKNTSDTDYRGSFLINDPGTDWRLVVLNKTGVALNSTGGNHYIRYRAENMQIQ